MGSDTPGATEPNRTADWGSIEVTMPMLLAGIDAFYRERDLDGETTVLDIYRSMELVRRQEAATAPGTAESR
jgi:hypothetical protein